MDTGDCQGMVQTGVAAAMNRGYGARVDRQVFYPRSMHLHKYRFPGELSKRRGKLL